MNETLKKWWESARDYFDALPKQRKILAGLSTVFVVVGLATVISLVKRDPLQVLYSDLRPEETKNVAKKLSEQNISYQVSEDNTTVMIPESQVYKARMSSRRKAFLDRTWLASKSLITRLSECLVTYNGFNIYVQCKVNSLGQFNDSVL